MTAALALVIVIVPLLTLRPDDEPAEAQTGIRTSAESLVTIPEVPKEQVKKVRRALAKFVDGLYVRAFFPEDASERVADLATAQRRIAPLFGRRARAVLSKKPEVFELDALRLQRGRVTFKGVATLSGNRATVALIHVKFTGVAKARGSDPLVEVRQGGTMLLHRTAQGWKIAGFDLRLRTKPLPLTTPSPTAEDES